MVIYNPAAGQRCVESELHKATRYLEEHGWRLTWRTTRGPGDATTYAREATAQDYEVVIAAGGDGTVGQIVNGLAGSDTALGVLPIGTANMWAKEIGIPLSSPLHPHALQEAAKILVEGQCRRVDVGMVNERYFLMWAGVGFDAEVTAQVEGHPETKRRLGALAFVIAALAQTLNLAGTRTRIILDGKTLRGRMILIIASNIQLYGAFMRIAPLASLNDGLLDVCIFKGYSGLAAYRHFFSVLLGLHMRDPEARYLQARHLIVNTRKPLPVQADGEIIGTTPIEVKVVPNYLKVIVPRHLSSHALRDENAIVR